MKVVLGKVGHSFLLAAAQHNHVEIKVWTHVQSDHGGLASQGFTAMSCSYSDFWSIFGFEALSSTQLLADPRLRLYIVICSMSKENGGGATLGLPLGVDVLGPISEPDALAQDQVAHVKPNLRPTCRVGPQRSSSWAQIGAKWPEFGAS
jgi:hypothetical protein